MLNSTNARRRTTRGPARPPRPPRPPRSGRFPAGDGGRGDHGQYQNNNSCVDAHVEAYLLNDTQPAEGTRCPGGPLPAPAPE
ncbi:alpha/beta hydrolase [Streptomyces sp. NPDC048551]|uniref:alpha/beta hydrolase n=1 Tax=Streptomyces sp. NPDC048551 TaxID=3155758 RepID=UPI0034431433